MSEPDHLWLRPMPNLMANNHRPAAFPFFYIEPAKKEFKRLTEKFTGRLSLKQAESIAPMGRYQDAACHDVGMAPDSKVEIDGQETARLHELSQAFSAHGKWQSPVTSLRMITESLAPDIDTGVACSKAFEGNMDNSQCVFTVLCAGNAPTLMSLKSLRKVAPTWMNVSKAIFDDKEAHEVRLSSLTM